MGRVKFRGRASAVGSLVFLSLLVAAPADAAPTERVTDGGFEATTCADGNRGQLHQPELDA